VIDTDAVMLLRDWIQSIRPSDCGP
jgi:hypothetical protein